MSASERVSTAQNRFGVHYSDLPTILLRVAARVGAKRFSLKALVPLHKYADISSNKHYTCQ
jgi:hypothetical protein